MSYTAPNIASSSATFAQLQAGGISSLLERVIAANGTATLAPTSAPTLSESGSGGTLPAATYYVVVTETNGIGETTASPVSSGQAITLGQDLVITYPSLKSGNTARNAYVGTSSTGPFLLAATGVTTSTTTISAPLPSNSYAAAPPTINTTAFTYSDANGNGMCNVLDVVRSFKNGNFDLKYKKLAWEMDTFLRGDPIAFRAMVEKLRHMQTAIVILNQAITDAATLVDANAGTLTSVAVGGGPASMQRTWP